MADPSNPAVTDSSDPSVSDPFGRLTAPFESAPTTGIWVSEALKLEPNSSHSGATSRAKAKAKVNNVADRGRVFPDSQ